MISATWPMPDSYSPSVRNDSEKHSLIKQAIATLDQKKGEVEVVFAALSSKEKEQLQKYLDNAVQKLSKKLSNKAIALQFQITTQDLDDKPKQLSLFDETDFGWNTPFEDEPF